MGVWFQNKSVEELKELHREVAATYCGVEDNDSTDVLKEDVKHNLLQIERGLFCLLNILEMSDHDCLADVETYLFRDGESE